MMHTRQPQSAVRRDGSSVRFLFRRTGSADIVIYYVIFGACWILFSDMLVSRLTTDPFIISKISIIKGWLFITVTALLLYVLIKRRVRMVLELQSKHLAEIGERERRIMHANRLYSVLSAVNRSIIRISDQQELLEEICRILVTSGGFKTAWIGWPDDDGWIVPTASCGDESGYLRSIRISVRDIPEGHGPSGTAIRERRPAVCDNIATNPAMALWRETALQNGFASSACFPFTLPDGSTAGLTIYSAEPAFFSSDEERNLLGEVADDIAFALQTIHTAATRQVAEQRLKEIIDNSPAMIYAFDRDGRLLLANSALAALCGRPVEQLHGRRREEIGIPAESALRHRDNDLAVLESGTAQLLEETNLQADGLHTYLTVKFPLASYDNAKEAVGGISTDITEHKKVEEALKVIRNLQAETEKIGHVGGWEFDLVTREQTWTEEVYRIHEVDDSFKPTVDNGISFYTPESRPLIEEAVRRAVEYGEPYDLELEIITAKGTVKNVNVIGRMDREHHKVIGFFQDITTRKQTERELHRKNEEIEQFIYTASHDLRSPLVTIKTFMGYLEKDLAEGNRDQLAQDISYINGAADKMKLLLDELLEMCRIGRVETLPETVTLKEVLAEVLGSMSGVVSDRTADIRLPGTDLILSGSRQRFCQIWQNLIENAIKYSPDASPRIELGIRQESGETVFSVKDYGIGIPPDYHARIFGIFEKLDPKSLGAGLGLSMVQRIVEKYGGRIWVESEGVGSGSCFKFTLPGAVPPK
ncbi:MAG: GAF domain-containing protein [Geobacteraceae bacterium]|nr:GAF domain-containing protein [Geobacteraceae bacterium]